MSPVAAPPYQREEVSAVFELLDHVGHQGGQCRIVGPDGREILIPESMFYVSRQDLVRLLEDGKLPFSKTGKHRRIRVGDLLDFKRRRDPDRSKALDALTEISQEMGGYGEVP